MKLTKEEFKAANNNIMTVMENHIIMLARCDRATANLIANEFMDLKRDADRILDELSKYAESQYNKAIDDVLKLPKYTFYDTSNEFMNIRIDAISIEDILKLKEQNKWVMKTIQT